MADFTSIAGPSQLKERKVSKKLTKAEILELLEKSDLSDYDSTNDEDYGWDSTSESERDSDATVDIIEMSDSGTEDATQQFPAIERDSLIDWKTDSSCMISHTFTKTESLLIQPTESTPTGYFRLFLTEGFLKKNSRRDKSLRIGNTT
ncbi:hypothetical protein TNCT_342921 [Trichonephila clavata]|uniref:Uncharacterized protein n=1 Tax=Trichonephila clavata TaxID=2740835 RepID=A0A8X6HNQ1_TRICU|nr:hypothetical protein TNCT_342921 [Trichonephila clavata]